MNGIIIFLAASLASFIGSLQLGPVNLFVIDTALNKNKNSAYWVAFGGIIPEFIYCGLAVYSGTYFLNNPTILIAFKILLIIILISVGVIYLLKKHKSLSLESKETVSEPTKVSYFMKGFSLAILNPQLLPFWMFVMVYFNSLNFLELKTELHNLAYITGAGFGAFLLLFSIILTINKFKTRILTYLNNKYYYKVLGVLFICIALQQLFTII